MEQFLKEQNRKLKKADEAIKINVVLGNGSCDLDSAISSIVFAYFLYKTELSGITVPILNVNREDLALRTEVIFFLEKANIPITELICIDEINLQILKDADRLNLFLVDHHELNNDQSILQDAVIQIIDHHKIDNVEGIKRCKAKIEDVGSCCTLIAEEFFEHSTDLMDTSVALLLYGTILLDTVCLQERAKRVTDKDRNIATRLETYLEGIVSKEELFAELQDAKFYVSNMSPEELLKKDTKYISHESTTVAIASLPMLLEVIIKSEDFLSALAKMEAEKGLAFIIVLGTQIDDKTSVKRQIVVYNKCQESLEKVSNYLLSLQNPSLMLRPLPLCCKNVHLFKQENLALSRKFVLPAMQNYLKTMHPGLSDFNNSNVNCNNNNNVNLNLLYLTEQENSDDTFLNYSLETVDFPDSPNHRPLLEITQILSPKSISQEADDEKLQSHFDEHDLTSDSILPDVSILSDGNHHYKRISVKSVVDLYNFEYNRNDEDDQRSLSSLSTVEVCADNMALYEDEDDIETLNEIENYSSSSSDRIPEISAAEEREEERNWKSCLINGEIKNIDMKVIEPYRKVLCHCGYEEATCNAIILFSACHLPDRSRKDYDYVMDNLFLYVVVTLNELVAEDYILVYLHGATESSAMPSFSWLKRCYQMIDRRLRKNLKKLYLVHPTFWLKTIVIMTRPFISTKFSQKLKFIYNLRELSTFIPLDKISIPEQVQSFDTLLYPVECIHQQ